MMPDVKALHGDRELAQEQGPLSGQCALPSFLPLAMGVVCGSEGRGQGRQSFYFLLDDVE